MYPNNKISSSPKHLYRFTYKRSIYIFLGCGNISFICNPIVVVSHLIVFSIFSIDTSGKDGEQQQRACAHTLLVWFFHIVSCCFSSFPVEELCEEKLSAMDVLARASMKDAARCDTHCELQISVNHQISERKWRCRDFSAARLFQCLLMHKITLSVVSSSFSYSVIYSRIIILQ